MLVQEKTTGALVSFVSTIGSGSDAIAILRRVPTVLIGRRRMDGSKHTLKDFSDCNLHCRICFDLGSYRHTINLEFLYISGTVCISKAHYIRQYSDDIYYLWSLDIESDGALSVNSTICGGKILFTPHRLTTEKLTLTNSKYSSDLCLCWNTFVLSSETQEHEFLSKTHLLISFDECIFAG